MVGGPPAQWGAHTEHCVSLYSFSGDSEMKGTGVELNLPWPCMASTLMGHPLLCASSATASFTHFPRPGNLAGSGSLSFRQFISWWKYLRNRIWWFVCRIFSCPLLTLNKTWHFFVTLWFLGLWYGCQGSPKGENIEVPLDTAGVLVPTSDLRGQILTEACWAFSQAARYRSSQQGTASHRLHL